MSDHPWDRRSLEWDLAPGAVVCEVGGYQGRWARAITDRCAGIRLFAFEPQAWAFERLAAVMAGTGAVVLPYGLGDTDGVFEMGDFETDGASFTKDAAWCAPDHRGMGQGELREIGGALRELGVTAIDLMLVNVEGYEYTLVPHMLARGIRPRALMLQTHPRADEDAALRAGLGAAGYAVLWDYGTVLSAWGCA